MAGDAVITVKIKVECSMWDALKLRVAGVRREQLYKLIEKKLGKRKGGKAKSEEV